MSVKLRFGLAAVALGAVTTAMAQPMPARRPGLWQTTMTAPGMPNGAMTMRVCSDPASDRAAGSFTGPMPGARGAQACAKHEFHRIAGGWAFHSVCAGPRGVAETTGVLTGDFQSRYHVAVDARVGGQMHHMTMDARWIGTCRPGTPPSMVLPNGQVMTMPSRPGA